MLTRSIVLLRLQSIAGGRVRNWCTRALLEWFLHNEVNVLIHVVHFLLIVSVDIQEQLFRFLGHAVLIDAKKFPRGAACVNAECVKVSHIFDFALIVQAGTFGKVLISGRNNVHFLLQRRWDAVHFDAGDDTHCNQSVHLVVDAWPCSVPTL